jgi:hypothetical protein
MATEVAKRPTFRVARACAAALLLALLTVVLMFRLGQWAGGGPFQTAPSLSRGGGGGGGAEEQFVVDNAPPEEADAEDMELMSGADGGGGGGGEDDDTPDAFHNVLDPIVGHKMAGKMRNRSLTVCSACTRTR